MTKTLSEYAYLRLHALKEELARSQSNEAKNDAKALNEALTLLGAPWGAVQIIALTDRIKVDQQGA